MNSCELGDTTPVLNLADRLTLLRFCFYIERQLHKRITPADLLENDTPESQARFLDERLGSERDAPSNFGSTAKALVSIDPNVKKILNSHLERTEYNFDADVEDVYRGIDTMDTFELNTTRPASDNLRLLCRTRHETTTANFRDCLSRLVAAYAALRSFIVPLEADTTTPQVRHVVLKPSQRWMDTLIETTDAINVEELNNMVVDQSKPFAQLGQSSFRAQILPVKGSQRPSLFLAFHHAVFDAVFITKFFEDLDALLSNSATELRCICDSVFADIYHLHKSGAMGQASKTYQLNKFAQLDNIRPCLWPRSKGPGFLIGDDEGWRHRDETLGNSLERRSQDVHARVSRGEPVVRAMGLASLPTLHSKYSIEPFSIVKCAVAIFNIEQIKQRKAVFATSEVGRKRPFQEPWVQQHLPNAMQVAAPTLE